MYLIAGVVANDVTSLEGLLVDVDEKMFDNSEEYLSLDCGVLCVDDSHGYLCDIVL